MRYREQVAQKLYDEQEKKRAMDKAIVSGKKYGPNNEELGLISISAIETG